MNDSKPRFIDMALNEAKRLKWDLGRQQYGPIFQGHPLEQLSDELVDALNYIEEAQRWGYDMKGLEHFLMMTHREVRNIYLNQRGERPE